MEKPADAALNLPAPDFTLLDQAGKPWRLFDQRGKVVALLFYPRDETLICTKQLCEVRNRWADYAATGAIIVGVSPDSAKSHKDFADHHELPIPLLSDEGSKISRQFTSHAWLPHWATRGVVVIDAAGIVRSRKVMLRIFRPHHDKVISAIRLAQIARHGIVIPSWQQPSPDQSTMEY